MNYLASSVEVGVASKLTCAHAIRIRTPRIDETIYRPPGRCVTYAHSVRTSIRFVRPAGLDTAN